MAVVQLTEYSYIGLFADARPSAPTKGAQFFAYDTGGLEYYDGTAWRAMLHADVSAAGAVNVQNVALRTSGGTFITGTTSADNANGATGLNVNAQLSAFAPTGTTAQWDRIRTPTTFKSATATASGDTAVWTPTSGKKFRLMGVLVQVTGEATIAGGGQLAILLRDGATDMAISLSCWVPNAAPASPDGARLGQFIPLGNGRLSAAANNVLNVNLSAALAAGAVRVSVMGTEE